MLKNHLIKVTNPKRSSMGKEEKLLGISMQIKDAKPSVLRLNAQHKAALVQPHSSHMCCRAVPLLGTHDLGREKPL